MTEDKRKQILDMLDTLQEHLLTLPDDMLLNIDPRDNESLQSGLEFIKQYNENLNEFTTDKPIYSDSSKQECAV